MSGDGVVARYLGDGKQFYPGIPARDLRGEDWARLGGNSRRAVREGGLYELVAVEGGVRVAENEMLAVTAVSGIGPKTAELLKGLGVATVGDLAVAEPARLVGVIGGEDVVEGFQKAAMALLYE